MVDSRGFRVAARTARFKPVASAAALAAGLVAALAGCGGGGSDANQTPSSSMTMQDYVAYRAQISGPTGGVLPTDAEVRAELLANQQQAVADLVDAQGQGSNVAALPALADAALHVLRPAAQGETLAQMPLEPANDWMQTWRTRSLRTSVWSDQGHSVQRNFLASTDSLGAPWPRLTGWTGAEAGFSAGTAASDSALASSLAAIHPELNIGRLSELDRVKLALTHSLNQRVALAGAAAGTGVMQLGLDTNGKPLQIQLPVVRSTQGVTGFQGSDYDAQVLADGSLRLLKITPTSPAVAAAAFASQGRLASALAESVRALVAPGGGGSAAEMVLPSGAWRLGADTRAALTRQGVTRAFDKSLAELPGVDGTVQMYLQLASTTVRLNIDTSAVGWQGAQLLGFTRNAQAAGSGGSVFERADLPTSQLYPDGCVWPTPDLRPFFLALVDPDGRVLALGVFAVLSGDAVIPSCS